MSTSAPGVSGYAPTFFGHSVAIDFRYAVVGARYNDDAGYGYDTVMLGQADPLKIDLDALERLRKLSARGGSG